ncbi:MAG: S9 family peptidase [Solobacterium sp.]|nr:S9 family peptidase [Solobacterium sp.]
MEKVVMNDITLIRAANGLKLSPDGKYAVYTVIEPDASKNEYHYDFSLVDRCTGNVRRLTYNGKNSGALWDNNETLLFNSVRKEEDTPEPIDEKTVFYRLNVNGGEAYEAFSIKANVQDTHKVKDGLYAMKILVDRNRPDPEKVDPALCKEEKDYHIFEEVPFWGNGRGFVSGKRSVLFLYDEKSGELTRLTGEYTSVSGMAVKDGKIAYVHRTWQETISLTAGISIYDTDSKETVHVLEDGLMKVENIAFNDLGLIFTACDMKTWGTGQLTDFYLFDEKEGTCRLFRQNSEELAFGDTPVCDCERPGGTNFKGLGRKLIFTAMKHYHTDLYELDQDGNISQILDFGGGAVICFDMDDTSVLFVGTEPSKLSCVYEYKDGEVKLLDDVNKGLLDNKYTAEPEYIPFTDRDGIQIDGWILKPMDFDPEKKYPGILEIHGGPRGAYGTLFFHEMQIWASLGYFVFFCNPRGGEGYGEAFADLRGKYGTIDFDDLMDFTDHVLKTYPQIDEAHIGAAGGSYGGFMCNWIEGHTDRFAAIASQRSISNWVADFGASEIGVTFDSNEMAATPWTDMLKMWEQSPLKYADQAKTPILFIHSLCDYNCPIDQGVEMFTAMKYFHVPSRMVVFEGENHGLSRTGKPKHRVRRLKEMTDWFEKYLKV